MNTIKKPEHAEPISRPHEAKTEKMSTKEDYYEPVVRGRTNLEENRDAVTHFFTTTEPNGEEPTHQRAMDVDKAAAIAGEFLTNVMKSVVKNANRRWLSEPTTTLPAPDNANDQPLSYSHSKDYLEID